MQIVLNADDFGYSPDTLDATIASFERGLLTSATIMANMPATADALEYARSRPVFSFGVHLTLTGSGYERPVTPAGDVESLVDDEGRFRRGRDVRLRSLLRRLAADEIERELRAQLRVVRDGGVPVSHVDSHRHLHKFAPFRAALRRVLPEFGVHRVRTVQDVYLHRHLASPTYLLGRRWQRRIGSQFTTTDHFYMPASAGDEEWEAVVPRLAGLPGRTIEVGVHPGTEEPWRRGEAESLAPFVEAARAAGHELVTWHSVSAP